MLTFLHHRHNQYHTLIEDGAKRVLRATMNEATMNMTAWFACLLGVSARSGCLRGVGYRETDEVTQLCVQTQELE